MLFPPILQALLGLPHFPPHVTPSEDVHSILRNLAGTTLILYVLWSSGDSLAQFGLRRESWKTAAPYTVGLLALISIFPILKTRASGVQLLNAPTLGIESPLAVFVAVLQTVAYAFSGMLIFGYLIPRLEEMTKRSPMIIAVPVIAFFLGSRFSYGMSLLDVLSEIFTGICFGVVFWVNRSLWPLVVAYATFTFVNYLVIAGIFNR